MADIGFNNVPSNQRIPGIYPEVEGDIPGQPRQWTLMIGQTMLSQPSVPVMVSSVANAVRRFGAGSMLASMVERYLASDPNGSLWVLPLQDAGYSYTVTFATGSAAITLPTNLPLAAGMPVRSTGNLPSGTTLLTYNSTTGAATVSANALTSATDHVSVGGINAKGYIDIAGTATESGALYLYVAGRQVALPVNQGDSASTIAGGLAAAINSYLDANDFGLKKSQRNFRGVALPATAASGSTITVSSTTYQRVTLTANHTGTVGNGIDIQLNYYGTSGQQEIPAGLTVVITGMGNTGALDPDLTGLDAALGDTQYDFIVQPYTSPAALDYFQTFMSDSTGRWSPLRKVYGHVFTAANFNPNGSSAVSFGTARNDRHMTVVAYEATAPMPPYDVAAAYTGTFAASSRVDPARPTQTLSIADILAPHRHQRFSSATRQTLLGCGLALMDYDADYTCNVLRAVTTYQLDANGTPDISYRDTETLYTLMAVVRQMTADWGAAFPRAKILDDDVAFGPGSNFSAGLPDQPIVTIKSGKAVLSASYSRMATGKGQAVWLTDVDSFTGGLILQRNSSDPTRLDALLPIVLASGLRVTAMKVDFALQASS